MLGSLRDRKDHHPSSLMRKKTESFEAELATVNVMRGRVHGPCLGWAHRLANAMSGSLVLSLLRSLFKNV